MPEQMPEQHHQFFCHRPFRRHRHHPPHPVPTPVPPPDPTGGGTPTPTPAPPPAPTPTPGTPPQWPTFTGTSQFVGMTANGVSIWYDPSLGPNGLDNANSLLADADRIVEMNNTIFGVPAQPVNVIMYAIGGMTDGTGGADHAACSFAQGGNIEVDASFGAPLRVSALFMAELSECAMQGNLCGYSTGEALSRWCAMVASGNALADFVTAPAWIQAGMPDYVSGIDPTDQDAVSIGCGMVFLSWLLSRSGITLPEIAQVMVNDGDGGSLASLYAALGVGTAANAFADFMAAINTLPGGSAAITDDDPFNALAAATASA